MNTSPTAYTGQRTRAQKRANGMKTIDNMPKQRLLLIYIFMLMYKRSKTHKKSSEGRTDLMYIRAKVAVLSGWLKVT